MPSRPARRRRARGPRPASAPARHRVGGGAGRRRWASGRRTWRPIFYRRPARCYIYGVAPGALHREVVDLDRLVLDIEARLRRHSHGRRIVVARDPGMQLSVDRAVFAPAFEDLLTMAWQLTRGRQVAHIAVGQLRGPEGLAYYVRDDGAGSTVAA